MALIDDKLRFQVNRRGKQKTDVLNVFFFFAPPKLR